LVWGSKVDVETGFLRWGKKPGFSKQFLVWGSKVDVETGFLRWGKKPGFWE
jgi:hypothetical protein